jgi:hypothetical protein
MRASTAAPACQIPRREVAFARRHDDTPGGERSAGLCEPLDEKALGQFCLGDFSKPRPGVITSSVLDRQKINPEILKMR